MPVKLAGQQWRLCGFGMCSEGEGGVGAVLWPRAGVVGGAREDEPTRLLCTGAARLQPQCRHPSAALPSHHAWHKEAHGLGAHASSAAHSQRRARAHGLGTDTSRGSDWTCERDHPALARLCRRAVSPASLESLPPLYALQPAHSQPDPLTLLPRVFTAACSAQRHARSSPITTAEATHPTPL